MFNKVILSAMVAMLATTALAAAKESAKDKKTETEHTKNVQGQSEGAGNKNAEINLKSVGAQLSESNSAAGKVMSEVILKVANGDTGIVEGDAQAIAGVQNVAARINQLQASVGKEKAVEQALKELGVTEEEFKEACGK